MSTILLFLIALTVYLFTLCPTVYVGDSGELITAAYTTGVPHPPGYPLFCILGKLISFLPIGTIAFRMNLMSSLFGAVALFVFYIFLTSKIRMQKIIAFGVVLL